MKAVVLAAGKGSRLAPFTDIIPKPLMPVGLNREGRFITIVEKILQQIHRAGIHEICIIVNYKAELIMAYLKENGGIEGVTLTYLIQSELDGNAGAFYRARHLLNNEDVLVSDCDNFIDDEDVFKRMVEDHQQNAADLTVGVCPVKDVTKYAIIKTGSGGRAVDIYEKPDSPEGWGTLAKSGAMILSAPLAAMDKEISRTASGEYTTTQIVKHCIEEKKKVVLHHFLKGFTDIGTWEAYTKVLKSNL